MTAIPFHVGDCVLLYNAASDKYDKLTLQRKLPDPHHRITFWDAISDTGETFTVGEHEIEHIPRVASGELVGSTIVGLGVILVLIACYFAMGAHLL